MGQEQSPFTASPLAALSMMQEQTLKYLNSYEELMKSATANGSSLPLGSKEHLQLHTDFVNKLVEASRMIFLATMDYTQASLSQTAGRWQSATQAMTSEIVKQQDKLKNG